MPIVEHGDREIKPSESGRGVMFVPGAERRKKQNGTTRKEVHICSGGVRQIGKLWDCKRDSGVEYKCRVEMIFSRSGRRVVGDPGAGRRERASTAQPIRETRRYIHFITFKAKS